MLFNNGENRKGLPQLELDCQLLNYKQNTNYLGVYRTTKLNWRLHIDKFNHKSQKTNACSIYKIIIKYTLLVSEHNKVTIFSQLESDLRSGGIFFRSKHTPKETAKYRQQSN